MVSLLLFYSLPSFPSPWAGIHWGKEQEEEEPQNKSRGRETYKRRGVFGTNQLGLVAHTL